MNYFDDSKQGVVDKSIDLWSNGNNIVFAVSHPLEKQTRFDSSPDVVHMFHGSSVCNWYSIMRNGLKNYSGTQMMSNGQVHGSGIYLATDMGMSLGYCKAGKDEHSIIGVVQVLNSAKYKKTDQIYVVPDEADVLLKYLIVVKSRSVTPDMKKMQEYLTVELPGMIKGSIGGSAGITMKRLNKEYMELMKRIKKLIKNGKQNDAEVDRSDLIQDKNNCLTIRWQITLKYTKIVNGKSIDRNVVISVVFPRAFPSSPCTITSDDSCVSPVPMFLPTSSIMEQVEEMKNPDPLSDNITYIDPVMRYDKWRSDVKIFKILEEFSS